MGASLSGTVGLPDTLIHLPSSGKPLVVWLPDAIRNISLKCSTVTEKKIALINEAWVPLKETSQPACSDVTELSTVAFVNPGKRV